jgi:hypothetical protein
MPRVTDDDRGAIVGLLRAHLVDDRLTLDEYTERVGQAWAADDDVQLDALVADLPPLTSGAVGARRANGARHGEGAIPEVTWRPTKERFRDPSTNRVMRVWVDVAGGQRHYVAED